MVNTEEFTRRLQKIMEYYDLTAASFADKIDVGRSSISHLLSGRNKPSLEFVMKIINAFPDVELYWLLNGKGDFPKRERGNHTVTSLPTPSAPAKAQDLFTTTEIDDTSPPSPEKGRQIRRIVIFYENGTFEAFEN